MKLNEVRKLIRKEIVEIIKEKSVSKAQQQAAGIALAAKRGDIPKSKLKGASKEMEKMPKKDLADFAKTRHKGLPSKKESVNEAKKVDAKVIASKMKGHKTLGAFMNKVSKMGKVSEDDLQKMLPDYIAGKDISKLFRESVNEATSITQKTKMLKYLNSIEIDGAKNQVKKIIRTKQRGKGMWDVWVRLIDGTQLQTNVYDHHIGESVNEAKSTDWEVTYDSNNVAGKKIKKGTKIKVKARNSEEAHKKAAKSLGLGDYYQALKGKTKKLGESVNEASRGKRKRSVGDAKNTPFFPSKDHYKKLIKLAYKAGARKYNIIKSLAKALSKSEDAVVKELEKNNLIGMTESVNEAKYNSTRDADDIFFLWDASIDDDRQGIEHGHRSSKSSGRRYSVFHFDNPKGFDKFKKDVEKLAKKNKWEYDLDNESLYIYESVNEAKIVVTGEYEGKPQKFSGSSFEKGLKNMAKLSNNSKDFVNKIVTGITDETSDISKKDREKLAKWYTSNVSESVKEARVKKVTRSMWKTMTDDQKESALLTVFDDPDKAEKWIDAKWNNLPPQASQMGLYEEEKFRARHKHKAEDLLDDKGIDYDQLVSHPYGQGYAYKGKLIAYFDQNKKQLVIL